MKFIEIVLYASIYLGIVATIFYILSFLENMKIKKKLFRDDELPVVSIMIPVHNEEKSIESTLKSILKSEYPEGKFEVVVVNDGSTDKTLEKIKKFEGKINGKSVRIFSKKQGGKGSALNLALKKVKGEIVFSMDADTLVEKQSVKNMIRYFKEEKVMCVSPAMSLYKPENALEKFQYIEYLTGLFLRKAFSFLNSINVTPGAFSAYRKSFFDKYGGYEEGNITEDLEVSLRIQYNNYIIENCIEAPVYTTAPKTFMHLLKQRRRWYVGLMRNSWEYRKMFSPKYGDMGLFVMPTAFLSIVFCIIVTIYLFFKTLFDVKDEILFFNSINFDFPSTLNLNIYFFEKWFLLFVTNPVVIFIGFFMIIILFSLYYASRKLGKLPGAFLGFFLFFIFFSVLFGIWWIVSIFYIIFKKTVIWK